VAVRGVHDEAVGPGRDHRLGLGLDVPVDPDRGAHPQPAVGVDGGPVQRGAHRADPGQHAGQPAVPDHRGQLAPRPLQQVEGRGQPAARI
jgi:hypothetical protein